MIAHLRDCICCPSFFCIKSCLVFITAMCHTVI
nr:MAG TPA: hypothetical protein [Caudoviricetes sp.]